MSTAPLRLAIIGCGRVVERYHLPALAAVPEVEPVAAVEPDPQRRAWLERHLPGRMVSADPDAVLDPTRCDVALIASPPASHAELARRCLAVGLSVLVEKPLATRPAAAEELVALAAAGDLVLATGFNRRFRGSWQAARRALAAGAPTAAPARFTIITDPGRWGLVLADAPSALAMLLDDVVPHAVDLLTWLFGRPIESVQAGAVSFAAPALTFDFQIELASGRGVSCRTGYGRHQEQLEAGIGGRTLLADPAMAVALRAGTGLVRALGPARTRLADAVRKASGRPSASVDSFVAQYRAFAAAVRGRPAPDLADGRAGASACRAVEALRTSLGEGGRRVGLGQDGRVRS